MPEKLLTIKEVAEYLKLPEEEIKRLVDTEELPAYRIGGSFLRFRKEQVDAIKSEIDILEKNEPEHSLPVLDTKGQPTHPYTDLENEIKSREPVGRAYDYTLTERVKDFFYFNDFYIFSGTIIIILLVIILNNSY